MATIFILRIVSVTFVDTGSVKGAWTRWLDKIKRERDTVFATCWDFRWFCGGRLSLDLNNVNCLLTVIYLYWPCSLMYILPLPFVVYYEESCLLGPKIKELKNVIWSYFLLCICSPWLPYFWYGTFQGGRYDYVVQGLNLTKQHNVRHWENYDGRTSTSRE